MADIKFSPEQVQGIASQIVSCKDEIEGTVNALHGIIIDDLCVNWNGLASDKYRDEFENLKTQVMDKFVGMLGDLNTQLLSISEAMQNADQDFANKIQM
ncbi:MAG: WXG100 family type VII secretion target [Clostridiales bacterium]|nr:WXG100 family type VII secretion target [Clostridiales bacterium]